MSHVGGTLSWEPFFPQGFWFPGFNEAAGFPSSSVFLVSTTTTGATRADGESGSVVIPHCPVFAGCSDLSS